MPRTQPGTLRTLLAAAVAVIFLLAPALAQDEFAKLTASDAAWGDLFGFAVSVDGDTALIAAINDTDPFNDSGSVYVFRRMDGAWIEETKLVAADAAAGQVFGWSVAVDGDTAMVGAANDAVAGHASGSVYVFTRSGGAWSRQARLLAADAGVGHSFGISVSLDGDTALVGAFGESSGGPASGAAYVFTRRGAEWTQQAKLTASDAGRQHRFGRSVSLSRDGALVGSGNGVGAAYVFRRDKDSWVEEAKLTPPDGVPGDLFAWSVALEGETAVVGAVGDGDPGAIASGSAYIFARRKGMKGIWDLEAKLTAADAAEFDAFGVSVSLDGSTLLVGAMGDDDASGSAYAFVRRGDGWAQAYKLTAGDRAPDDWFGRRVALSGRTALVGASQDDDVAEYTGSAYIFDVPAPRHRIGDLASSTIALELHPGIESSLLAKLDASMRALQDPRANNEPAVIREIQAFIQTVEAQRGRHVPEEAADHLIAAAEEIISLLN